MEKTKQEIKKEIKEKIENELKDFDTKYECLFTYFSYYLLSIIRKKGEIADTYLNVFKEYVSLFSKTTTDLVNLFYSDEYLKNIDIEYKGEVIEELTKLNAVPLKVFRIYKKLIEVKRDYSNIEIIDLRFIFDELIDLKVDINEILYIPLRELEDF